MDEFGYLSESAAQAGVTGPLPTVARVRQGPVSALRWGAEPPRVVFLHGGGQNAHTWDTVVLRLGLPALAIDLPGHGHSDWREDGDYGPPLNALAVEPVIRDLAPGADLVVGMSLGGLTAIRLAVSAPELVRRLVLVDITPSAPERITPSEPERITPSAPERRAQMTRAQMGAVALVGGERVFPTLESMVDAAAATSPHRSRDSLRRGVFHNSRQLDDGSWTWRYDTFRKRDGFLGLWDDVASLHTPTTLVRGGRSVFVNDDDAQAFARAAPGFRRAVVVADAGHSVQGDQPLALAEILRSVLTEL